MTRRPTCPSCRRTRRPWLGGVCRTCSRSHPAGPPHLPHGLDWRHPADRDVIAAWLTGQGVDVATVWHVEAGPLAVRVFRVGETSCTVRRMPRRAA